MGVFKMAWRNVWRNRRRSIVTIAAMSLALLVMILYSGLVRGMLVGLERNILDRETGDIQVFAVGYRTDPSIYSRIDDADGLVERLEQAGYRVSPRLLASGLAAAGDASAGVSFRGVQIERDAGVSAVYRHVARGGWLDPADPHGVVIGRRLARTLGVDVGDELVVLSQAADGSMANDLYTVRGVLKGIGDEVDRAGVYLVQPAFRELFVVPDGAHQLVVRGPDGKPLEAATAEVQQLAGDQNEARSWRQLLPTLSSMLDSTGGVVYVMFVIVCFAVGILILNAMLMAVFERIREFGVLKALGVGPGAVLRIILTESLIQAVLAVLIGGALSIPGNWYLSTHGIEMTEAGGSISGIAWDTTWISVVDASNYAGPIFTLVVIVLIAVLYPAVKAARIRPIAAIRHQ